MKIGEKLKGQITGIQPYGAFVELETDNKGKETIMLPDEYALM